MGSDSGVLDATPADTPSDGPPLPRYCTLSPTAEPTTEEFCEYVAEAGCVSIVTCCSSVPDVFDVEACIASGASECRASLEPALARPYLTWDPVAAGASLLELQQLTCECDLDFPGFGVDRSGFFGGIVGERPLGADCTPEIEGDDIELSIAIVSCEPGTVCVETSVYTCEPLGGAGDTCAVALQCGPTAPRCLGGDSPVCGIGLEEGSLCLIDDQCQSLDCSSPTSRCAPAPRGRDDVYCPRSP